ncbi:MAG: hypothetical protein RLZZ239_1921 [Pseudomonadota bacterium]
MRQSATRICLQLLQQSTADRALGTDHQRTVTVGQRIHHGDVLLNGTPDDLRS